MEISAAQFSRIESFLPVQRGKVSHSNVQVINAILCVAENGCKWRSLPRRFGSWHTVCTRMTRWAKAGVLDRLFEEMLHQQLIRIRIGSVSRDGTIAKLHLDGTGALKKRSPQATAKSRAGWTTKIHGAAADARTAIAFSLTGGQAGDAPAGRDLLRTLPELPALPSHHGSSV
jgi:transposase